MYKYLVSLRKQKNAKGMFCQKNSHFREANKPGSRQNSGVKNFEPLQKALRSVN
ncbi:hypothetical protein HMPREF0322_00683 [Desulfitobacterium hafniense DP7]|uniref:Uncharacterized protein n=1 Tax=Desulfitobacterium hafniense DP7 TaxID=537010 RepID=G9XIA7_DESHA|nr:hypothetical protein HMPREF0322_00683 [Desulfitobacterium hafniense DP7]